MGSFTAMRERAQAIQKVQMARLGTAGPAARTFTTVRLTEEQVEILRKQVLGHAGYRDVISLTVVRGDKSPLGTAVGIDWLSEHMVPLFIVLATLRLTYGIQLPILITSLSKRSATVSEVWEAD